MENKRQPMYPRLNTREGKHTEIQPQPGVTGGNPFPNIQGVLHFLAPQSVWIKKSS